MPATTTAIPSIGGVFFKISNLKKILSISFEDDDDDVYGYDNTPHPGGIIYLFIVYQPASLPDTAKLTIYVLNSSAVFHLEPLGYGRLLCTIIQFQDCSHFGANQQDYNLKVNLRCYMHVKRVTASYTFCVYVAARLASLGGK